MFIIDTEWVDGKEARYILKSSSLGLTPRKLPVALARELSKQW